MAKRENRKPEPVGPPSGPSSGLNTIQQHQLAFLERTGFFAARGDLQLIDGKWYVTHSGLLRLAQRKHCSGIHTETVCQFCTPIQGRWVVKAVVYKSLTCRGFEGLGDADRTNVSPLVRGAELRVAETRAVNRALRKAYGIGLCSVEELGNTMLRPQQSVPREVVCHDPHELRDRLLLLIREHQLDAAQVKRYAAHFCGTSELRNAGRDRVENFVRHLTQVAAQGREQLAQLLAAYATQDAQSASNSEAA